MGTLLSERAAPFLAYLEAWHARLPQRQLADFIAGEPERVALISIDVINGFCVQGPLASPRVARIITPVADLLTRAHALGVRNMALTQDTHDPDAVEFGSYPPHCVRGTAESEAVDALKALPFYDTITIVPKNSISSAIGTSLGAWIAARPAVDRFIIVGDCTDLCTYQAALQLRLDANAHNLVRRIVVPAIAVDTYDTPVMVAHDLGIFAHDAELHHLMFLHHMALNGVEVVAELL